MNCRQVSENLSALLDEALGESLRRDVEAHVRECSVCACELDTLRTMRSSLRTLPKIKPPADAMDRLRAALAAEVSREQESVWPRRTLLTVLGPWRVAAGIVAVCLATWMLRESRIVDHAAPPTSMAENEDRGEPGSGTASVGDQVARFDRRHGEIAPGSDPRARVTSPPAAESSADARRSIGGPPKEADANFAEPTAEIGRFRDGHNPDAPAMEVDAPASPDLFGNPADGKSASEVRFKLAYDIDVGRERLAAEPPDERLRYFLDAASQWMNDRGDWSELSFTPPVVASGVTASTDATDHSQLSRSLHLDSTAFTSFWSDGAAPNPAPPQLVLTTTRNIDVTALASSVGGTIESAPLFFATAHDPQAIVGNVYSVTVTEADALTLLSNLDAADRGTAPVAAFGLTVPIAAPTIGLVVNDALEAKNAEVAVERLADELTKLDKEAGEAKTKKAESRSVGRLQESPPAPQAPTRRVESGDVAKSSPDQSVDAKDRSVPEKSRDVSRARGSQPTGGGNVGGANPAQKPDERKRGSPKTSPSGNALGGGGEVHGGATGGGQAPGGSVPPTSRSFRPFGKPAATPGSRPTSRPDVRWIKVDILVPRLPVDTGK